MICVFVFLKHCPAQIRLKNINIYQSSQNIYIKYE